ncbi:MAG: TIR domain-containing protein [Burkholderiaceae bacterium]|nr:TIR domain-containing protein [Burkholderiaceae bacterium]
MATQIQRRCFVSYHHADQAEVDEFIRTFDHAHNLFSARGLGQEMSADIVNSTDTDYVMRAIRERYLKGSSVTMVMLGRCTWSRRYVDWEIQASLRQGPGSPPNGLLGIKLPSFDDAAHQFPERFDANLISPARKAAGAKDCYARHMSYPSSLDALATEIEAAFWRRENQAHLAVNSRDRFANNRACT